MFNEIEKLQESEITCPYCGWENTDSWESGLDNDGDGDEFECGNDDCCKKFRATKNIIVSYNTHGLCKENNTKHNWEEFDFVSENNGKRCKGRKCLTCGKYEFDKTEEEKNE